MSTRRSVAVGLEGQLSNPVQRRLNDSKIDDLVAQYEADSTIDTLADKFGMHRTTVMTDPVGNHEFLVYVEDLDEPGTGIDRFWIQVSNKNGDTITESSFDPTAIANATAIEGGNIVAPHTQAKSPTTGKVKRR